MRFVVTREAEEFARRTEAFLSQRMECNVLATVLLNVLGGLYADGEPVFAYGLDAHGRVRFAALQTPPWPLLVSELAADAAPAFVASWLEADPRLRGVNGPAETARAIAAAWCEQTGGESHCRMRQMIHVLTSVSDPPRPARGRLRVPREDERGLIVAWVEAFAREAGVIGADRPEQIAASYLARQALFVWEDGEPTAMVAANPAVAGVVRIGFVYTPPEQRRRGYASTAVAAASRRALSGGAQQCRLFTDAANPTSNKMYAEIGYRRVADWEEHEFEPQSTNASSPDTSP